MHPCEQVSPSFSNSLSGIVGKIGLALRIPSGRLMPSMLAPQSTNARLQAAQGFAALGLPQDAWDELENIKTKHRAHPSVLKVRLEVARALGKWEMVETLARTLAQLEPDDPLHAVNLAQAVRHLAK